MAQQQSIIQEISPLVGTLHSAVPQGNSARPAVDTFLSGLRPVISRADNEVRNLRQQVNTLAQLRPATTETAQDDRFRLRDALEDAGLRAEEGSTTIEVLLSRVTPVFAEQQLRRLKSFVPTFINDIGCWMSSNVSGHPNGYLKVNLRNTVISGSKLDIQPWAHQLAVVASGEGASLRLTSDGSYHVSHLCHNGKCFNPDHVIVETEMDNKARNSCHASFIIVTPDGTTIDPCTHWRTGWRRSCILKKHVIQAADRGKYMVMTGDGPRRRG